MLQHVLKKPGAYFLTWPEHQLNPVQRTQAEQLLQRRVQGEPVAYLTGKQGFWSLSLHVNSSTLIPRPETELLVEKALEIQKKSTCRVLDLGTGTGAIALALARERPQWHITGVDRQQEAVNLAKKNSIDNQLEQVVFRKSNWFSIFTHERFDLIISNPPYVEENDHHLLQGDVRFEPRSALTSGPDGLQDIRHIASQAMHYLNPEGWILLEHGDRQAALVRDLLEENGYSHTVTHQDIGNRDRVTLGQKSL